MRDAVGNVQSVLVLGGGSDIAVHTVKELMKTGRCDTVILAVRRPESVSAIAEDFRTNGVSTVDVVTFDGAATDTHESFMKEVFAAHGDIDVVLSAFGVLGDQDDLDNDPAAAAALAQVNFSGQVSAITAAAQCMKSQGHGTIVVISSVAGERVRKDNAVYGATKAGLDGFCQGLNDRLVPDGVNIVIVRPGFVHTPMTEGLEPAPFATTPEAVAQDIVRGIQKGSRIVWSPSVLRYVFTVLRHLPAPIWRIVSNR